MTCSKCGQPTSSLKYLKDRLGWCSDCFYSGNGQIGQSASVITDDIPGGLEVKHGVCHEDGSPRKFYSKSELKRTAFEAGWTVLGDTPKPNPRLVEARLAREESKR